MINQKTFESFCSNIFEAVGFSAADAREIAEILVRSDMRGVVSHGTRLIPKLLLHIQGGGVDPRAKPEIVEEGPAWSMIDAHGAMGHLAAHRGAHVAMETARQSGIGMAGVRQGNHLGPLGAYALMCAEAGMVGLISCNTNNVMAVTGSCEKSIGNNPFAFAAPTGNEPPIVLDMACSAAAGNKVAMAAQNGTSIPPEWTIDAEGRATTDPLDYLQRGGALLPVGGHKGYGLAIMVEVLAGVLTGASLTGDIKSWVTETDQVSDEGYSFIALDVKSFMPLSEYQERIDGLIRRIRSSRKAKGVDRIYLPGEIEHEHELKTRAEGISLQDWHVESLKKVAVELGLVSQFASLEAEL